MPYPHFKTIGPATVMHAIKQSIRGIKINGFVLKQSVIGNVENFVLLSNLAQHIRKMLYMEHVFRVDAIQQLNGIHALQINGLKKSGLMANAFDKRFH
jgi:hypothetical protein